MTQVQPLRTPCVRVCAVNPKTGWCEGCFRTLKEIANWGRFSTAERDAIMASLPARQAAVEQTAAQ